MDTEQGSLDLEQTLDLLRRHKRLIALCFLVATCVAYLYTKHEPSRYTATASLVFDNEGLDQQAAGLPVLSSNDQPAQQNTNLKLVELGDTAGRTARVLKMTKLQVSESVSVDAPGESNIVNVAATAGSPTTAAAIANTYSSEFVKEQQDSSLAYYASALRLVKGELASLSAAERESTAGKVLQEREQSLRLLARLPAGVRVAQTASPPSSPSSPSAMRNTLVGALLGLIVGLLSAFLLDRLDLRVRDPKELEALHDLPLLGVVPAGAVTPASATSRGSYLASSPEAIEAFQMLRARLRYLNTDRELKTLLIASGASGDGKTTVALNLARAEAVMGSRVLLLEIDMRLPSVAGRLNLRAGPGLADVLTGAVSVESATQSVQLGSPATGSQDVRLDVISAGALSPANPALLIESPAMRELLARARADYDLVVIDPPELNAVSDAYPLLGKVDGVIIVNHTDRDSRNAADLQETLRELARGCSASSQTASREARRAPTTRPISPPPSAAR